MTRGRQEGISKVRSTVIVSNIPHKVTEAFFKQVAIVKDW